MAQKSTIEWTDSTWNPVTGCTKVSPGCQYCYAETFAERWRGIKNHPYEQGFDLRIWPERLNVPPSWKKPRRIFVNSMSDMFHKDVPDSFIKSVFNVMRETPQHIYQLLTKRSERMKEWTRKYCSDGALPKHICLGVSIENQDYLKRVFDLQQTPAQVRFLSIEPLLDEVNFKQHHLKNIHWVIVGGESGPKARPMQGDWVRNIRNQCQKYNVKFFFKQWGAYNEEGKRVGKKKADRLLDGRTWNEFPLI